MNINLKDELFTGTKGIKTIALTYNFYIKNVKEILRPNLFFVFLNLGIFSAPTAVYRMALFWLKSRVSPSNI